MKRLLQILALFLFFIVVIAAIVFKIVSPSKKPQPTTQMSAPSFTVATDSGTQDQNSTQIREVKSAFLTQIDNNTQIKLERAKIVLPYALQDWSDENKGGEALLTYDGSWKLISLGGGAWDVDSLIAVGVPSDIAKELIGS